MTYLSSIILFSSLYISFRICEFWINPLLLCEAASNLVEMFMEKTSVNFCVAQDCPYPLKVCVGSFNWVSSFDRWLPCGFLFINNLGSIFKSAILFSLLLLSKGEKISFQPPYGLNSLLAHLSPFTLVLKLSLSLNSFLHLWCLSSEAFIVSNHLPSQD